MNRRAREKGQGLVEYALILVLIAVVVIVILTILGGSVAVAYARIVGGLNGQVITGVGEEFIVASFDQTYDGSGPCTATITNITIIALQDGAANEGAPISVPVSRNGVDQVPITATTNGSGIAHADGPYTYSAACPLTVNIGGRTITFN